MRKKKSLISIILTFILLLSFSINSLAAENSATENEDSPTKTFIELMDNFFKNSGNYRILEDNKDVSDIFYNMYVEDFKNDNIKVIWDAFKNKYCVSWSENNISLTRASRFTPYKLFYYLDYYEGRGVEITIRLDGSYTVSNGTITNWQNPSLSVHDVGGTGTVVSANPTQISTWASVSYDKTQITHSARFTLVVSVFTLTGTKTYSFPHTASFVTNAKGVYIDETQS